MTETKNSRWYNVFTILTGAMLLGFCWRLRGENGWGSSWGLLFAGAMYTMFAILAVGERKRLDIGWFGLTALSFMMTVPSWGTLLSQITGILYSEELWGSVETPTPNFVHPASAIFLMLCLGFGLATIWGVLLGRAYSGKPWRLRDLILLIAVFYAVNYLSKATVSHWILNLVQPEAAQIYEPYLREAGITDSVYRTYMQHFDNLAWAKKLDGGRNYFSSIQAISSMISSAAVLLVTRFVLKDKRSANIGFVVCAAFSFAITLADLWFFFAYGGYHMAHESYLPEFVDAWGTWEFSTGFLAGGIITFALLKMPKQEDVPELVFSGMPKKLRTAFSFLLGLIFALGVNIVRPILERLRYNGKAVQISGVVIAVLLAAAVCFGVAIKYGFSLEKIRIGDFMQYALPGLFAYSLIVYMFVADPDGQRYKYTGSLTFYLVCAAAVVVLAWCILAILRRRAADKNKT